MGFPQLSNIAKNFVDTINSRAGNNVRASQIMPWIRVTSTLDKFLSLESSRDTETFAQRYGNVERSGRIGVDSEGNSVYAEGDTRGYRPSPTINEVSVSQGNEGLSKKISFTIVCYSLGQAELMMQYFLEPGNMCLVEWGENNAQSVSQKAELDTCSIAAYNNLQHIQKKRAQSGGTYDAVLGTITGGDVKFGSNETYEISVELTSIGELPAYLQHHKNITSSAKTTDTGLTFSKSKIKRASKNNVGLSLFMQMFNDLPAHKRTKAVKDLENEEWATDTGNFINMDKEIREDIVRGTEDARVNVGGENFTVPSDTPIFSEKRFIRCELAFHILDMQSNVKLEPVTSDCPSVKSSSGKIRWQNTLCRAHEHMYSANSDFLYIPNKKAPEFDLVGALKSEEEFKNPIQDFKSLKNGENQVDLHPTTEGTALHFPANVPLNFPDQGGYDNQFLNIEADSGGWGYLRHLFINFDFFCECIQSPGLVTKELWYKILNGMSSAVNLYWDFQIIPRGAIKKFNEAGNSDDLYYQYFYGIDDPNLGDEELQIVDASFIGKSPNGVGKAKFQSRGLKTPFLESSFGLDIPSAMKGQVIGNKLSNSSSEKQSPKNPTAEQREQDFKGVFSGKKDSVLEVLNSIRKQEAEANDTRTQEEKEQATADEIAENKKSNFEMFVNTACIIPNTQDRSARRDFATNFWDWWQFNNVKLSEIMMVGAWDDSTLLKTVQRFDDGFIDASGAEKESAVQQNLPILPIKFDFTIHGVSGIRVGDTFNITDLPLEYKKYIFQVTEVEHNIAQNIWTTKVTGKMRKMLATEEEPTEYK